MLDTILKRLTAESEGDTESSGILSYKAEIHSFAHGVYDGMKTKRPAPSELPDNPDVQAEQAYYKGAYVIGTILQLLILVVLATFGVGMSGLGF